MVPYKEPRVDKMCIAKHSSMNSDAIISNPDNIRSSKEIEVSMGISHGDHHGGDGRRSF